MAANDFGFDIEADYFDWLCDLVHLDQGETGYLLLAKDLHHRKFYALVPHDENRASDGIELREYYMREINYPKYLDIGGECSVLEMLIALARRINFEMDDLVTTTDRTTYWFWEMIDNLGLMKFDDESYYEFGGSLKVEKVLDRFLNRRYSRDGMGGLFPLEQPSCDQREVEIWYQMNCYLSERER